MPKAVLLIIDMMNDGFEGWDEKSRQTITTSINELAAEFREKNLPVFWVRQEFESDLSDAFVEMRKRNIKKYIKGTEGVRILSELIIKSSDLEIIKKRYSAFFGTELDSKLKEIQPEFIVLAGINTHACIRTTAVDAYQRDYDTILATDCIQSYSDDWHKSSLEYLNGRVAELKSNRQIFELLAHL